MVKGIAQLFTEMGESYVELIANGMSEIASSFLFGWDGSSEEVIVHDVEGKFCLYIIRGYIYLVCSFHDLLGSGEAMMIVEALLEVTSHPEDTIAELTYNFWYRLSSTLTRRYNNVRSRVVYTSFIVIQIDA